MADTGNADLAAAPGSAQVSAADLEAAHRAASRNADAPSADLPVSLLNLLFRLAPTLVGLLDMGARDYGLGFARGRVLWALRESGPVLMRALSDALGVSPRTVTGLVDALEADGWVTRAPHPGDRRATIISLTPAATSTLERLDESYRTLAYDLLRDIPDDDLSRCRGVIRQLEDRLEAAVATRIEAFGQPGAHGQAQHGQAQHGRFQPGGPPHA
ncbi:MAG TPA: MarR family transcriptional regulator [Streptosporangiaceae bacterium]|nr:MarR family transcriptional regulator [Streptosporangiaceae bacterium]